LENEELRKQLIFSGDPESKEISGDPASKEISGDPESKDEINFFHQEKRLPIFF